MKNPKKSKDLSIIEKWCPQTSMSKGIKKVNFQSILFYFQNDNKLLSFGQYLKQFLYRHYQMTTPFEEVEDEVYIKLIYDSFRETHTPHSFTKTSSKIKNSIKNWLKNSIVKRETVFILGFGLSLNDEEVREFLTRGNRERSFDFHDATETVYWFCYHYHLPYIKAAQLLAKYQKIKEGMDLKDSLWEKMSQCPEIYMDSEEKLLLYLSYLKFYPKINERVYEEFFSVYERMQTTIASVYNLSNSIDGIEKHSFSEDIMPMDIENVLYAEMSKNKIKSAANNNLTLFSKKFKVRKLTRQYLYRILNKKEKPDRFAFLTFLFFIYSHDIAYEDALIGKNEIRRLRDYIREANEILSHCHMDTISSINPYETLLLLCLLSEEPLEIFYDFQTQNIA